MRFEELVREPERVLAGICDFLGLPYQPEMAEPYREGAARMVDGPHAASRMLGDVKFLGHGRVDPAAAERWRKTGEPPLGEPARQVARDLGYLDALPGRGALVPLQTGSPDRRPLFCVHPVGGEVIAYRELARRLGPEQPVYGLQSLDPAIQDLREMAAHYLTALREVQPEGPYRLAGWSMGGIVAYEMARQLAERGDQVEILALIDTASPTHWVSKPEPGEAEMVALFASDLARLHGLGIPDADLSGLDGDGALALVLDVGRETGLLPPGVELHRAPPAFRPILCQSPCSLLLRTPALWRRGHAVPCRTRRPEERRGPHLGLEPSGHRKPGPSTCLATTTPFCGRGSKPWRDHSGHF